ncbi:MAG: glycosyltransferase, partial [Peptostreptococcaceae bacterium]
MKKVLMLASVASMIDQFNMQNIAILQEQGYDVHVAANFEQGSTSSSERMVEFKKELSEKNISYFQIDFSRNVTNIPQNIKAYAQIKKLLVENEYEFIHCHSPIGGVCGRIAAKITGTKVIYTAHGFHFYKGAPKVNWMIYYPIEKVLSYITDILITINKEDYELAKKKMKAKKVEYVPGVGVDIGKFASIEIDKEKKRRELGLSEDNVVLLSVGELNKNKNHEVIIRGLAELKDSNVHYIIAGRGELESYLNELAKELSIVNQVHLLGFRTDVSELYKVADVFCFPSYREGLSVAMMEAIASG